MLPFLQSLIFWSSVALFVIVLSVQPVYAQSELLSEFTKLDETALEDQRGGFMNQNGFNVSVGLERITTLNGQIIHSVKLDLGDLAQLSARGFASAGNALSPSTTIFQNGPGNVVSSELLKGLSNGLLTTVVQNSLDNQHLQNVTVINATVSGMESMRNVTTFSDLQLNLRGN